MRNYSYENDFDLHENKTECRTHFHMNGFALRLVLKQRPKRTRKWPIAIQFDLAGDRESWSNFSPQIQVVSRFHNMAKGS